VELKLTPISSIKDIPTGVAVHGTNKTAWETICTDFFKIEWVLEISNFSFTHSAREGLSKMKRNHIHLAQDVAGKNVVSGQGPLFLLPKLYVYQALLPFF